MEDGECKKIVPKLFRDETAENVNGYPAYRRKSDGRTVQIGRLVAEVMLYPTTETYSANTGPTSMLKLVPQ